MKKTPVFAAFGAAAVLAGCGTAAAPVHIVVGTATPAPSLQAEIHGTCTSGFFPGLQGSVFEPGTPGNETDSNNNIYYDTPAYQVTLANTSTVPAFVDGFTVVFYDGSRAELGSDIESVSEEVITPGQSLTWTETSYTDTNDQVSKWNGSDRSIPAAEATCSLVQWTHPPGE